MFFLWCGEVGLEISMSLITRSPAQKSACKDLGRNGQSPAITPKATYTPTSKRAGSRSKQKKTVSGLFQD
ncbi:hypothetical protein DB326_00910 [Lacticaseibacillus casei]|nr:hypothetical protein DB326_00910 [Lacticaseibacillus casei]